MKKLILVFLTIPINIFVNAQNVGIGTAAPSRLLHINGSNEILRIQGSTPWIGFMNNSDADYKGFLYYPDTALVMGSASGSNQPLVLAPNNTGLLYANAQQRVGIGTAAPAEKLDVNGNVNVQGNLKVNGNAGQPGQVLRVNNDGTQSWANTFGYKNRKVFITPGITTWTVPANVKEIMIECVGGGGGGSTGGGGGAGGYCIAVVKVVAGNVININVGNFGAGATTGGANAGFGSASLASGPEFSIISNGGGGASSGFPGAGGLAFASGDSLVYVRSYSGGPGVSTTEEYTQLNTTTFLTIRKFGNGGVCPYDPYVVSTGGFYSFNSDTFELHQNFSAALSGFLGVGYGGAGNFYVSINFGIDGGRGLIAISW
jgi:hypothetical protein